uniref:Large ribosomal subunit protein mL64 n=1 Tax=Amblyomma aureolatum TaxID=187763 RepID=A0A1E1XI08_9ACAR
MLLAFRSAVFSSPKLASNSLRRCTGSVSEASAIASTSAAVRTLSKEEIDRKRDVSRLSPRQYARGVKLEYTSPTMDFEYNIKNMRLDYAKFGSATGINPGIMWPSKEELQDMVHIEKKFYPTLQQLFDEDRAKQQAEVEERRLREEEIERNMAKLANARIEMLERETERKAKSEEQRLQREQMILEVREYIGYNVEPSDPKFKEVMEMKEEERKKAQREAKKKAKQEKMLAKLMAVGATGSDEAKATAASGNTAEESADSQKTDP